MAANENNTQGVMVVSVSNNASSSNKRRRGNPTPVDQGHDLFRTLNLCDATFDAEFLDQIEQGVRLLIEAVSESGHCEGIAPLSLQASLIANDPANPIWKTERVWVQSGTTGDAITFREVREIVESAVTCSADNDTGPVWDVSVNARILSTASSLSEDRAHVHVLPLIDAELRPELIPAHESLVGLTTGFGLSIHSLSVQPPEYIIGSCGAMIAMSSHADINPSKDQHIAMTIVSGSETESTSTIKLRLETWAYALFRQFAQVSAAGSEEKDIYHPYLLVVGSIWKFVLTQGVIDCASSTDSPVLKSVTLFHPIYIGDVSSFSGCLQVLASLQAIWRWLEDEYPWPGAEQEVARD